MYHTGTGVGVDHTGAAATMTWTGANSVTWSTSSSYKHNWSNSGADFTWVNQEVQTNFPSSATRKAITVSGTVIAHGLNISAAGYSFSGGSLTVTNGGIVTTKASQSVRALHRPRRNPGRGRRADPQHHRTAAYDHQRFDLQRRRQHHHLQHDRRRRRAQYRRREARRADPGRHGRGHHLRHNAVQRGHYGQFRRAEHPAAGRGFPHVQRRFFRHSRHDQHQLFHMFTLGAAASTFGGTLNMQQAGTLTFVPPAGVTNTFTGAINTTGPIIQNGAGTTILSGSCAYPTGLTIASGTLGLRDVTNPTLFAGIFRLAAARWEFNNVSVDSNYTGVVSGSGGLNKSGVKKLTISGSSGNVYGGDTNILQGSLDLNKTSGYAIPGNLNLSPTSGVMFVRLLGDNQMAPSATINFSGSTYKFMELLGHGLTVSGISDSTGTAFIENSDSESGDYGTGVLTIDSAASSVFNGCLRNNGGTGTGTLALVKNGSGTLTLSGNRCGIYTGGLTVNDGTLDYSGGILPSCSYTVSGGTLYTGTRYVSIGAFQISGGTVTGTGTLTSSEAYDLQAGTVNVCLGGSVGLNKSTSGTVLLSKNLPGGAYTISGGTLNIGGLVEVDRHVPDQRRHGQRQRHADQFLRLRHPRRHGQHCTSAARRSR